MVPEVSLFVAGGVSYNGSLGFRSTNSSGAMGPLPPPSPHKLNGSATSALHRPTPDFSAMFDNSGGGGRNPFPHYTEPAVSSPAPQQTGVTRPAAVPLAYPSYNPVGFTGNVSGYASGEPLRYEQQQQPVNHTSAPYPSQGDNIASASGQPETGHSPIHPDVIKLLNWQNEQLKLLQEQVQTLLNCSPGAGMKTSCSAVQTECPDAAAARNQSTNQTTTCTGFGGRSMSTASTNTSSVWPEIQRGMDRLHQAIQEEEEEEDHSAGLTLTEMRNSNIKVNSSDGDSLRSPAPPLNLDMPDFAESDCSPDIRRQEDKESWESPVLGESVSMYAEQEQQQEVHRVYNDILTKVNKLLAEPEQPQQYNEQQQNQSQAQQILLQQQQLPQQNQSIPRQISPQPFQQQLPPSSNYQDTNQYSIIAEIREGSSEGGNVDPTAATLARLRQLGVSFINPEDLQTSGERSTRAPEYSNLFLPRAASPSQSVWTNSTDTSLEISSLALKYLDESQLSKLADKHRGDAGERSASNMSLATTEFLRKHGLDQDTTRNPLRPLDNLTNTPTRGTTRQRNPLDLRRTTVERFREMKRSNGEGEDQRLSAGYRGEQVNEVYAAQRIQFVQTSPPSGGQAALRRSEELPAGTRRRKDPTLPTYADAYDQRPRNIQSNPPPLPELSNRVLDITAIKNQPKLL